MKCLDSLKSEEGIKKLNDYLADYSYIEGYQPSQSDVQVFEALSGTPADNKPHARRWYKHLASFEPADKQKFAPATKDLGLFGLSSGGAAAAAASTSADDDLDLFGSDDDVDEEAERLREERLKQYSDKKIKKPGVIAKSSVVLDCKPWDDETDLKEMERLVRTLSCNGLVWGASKLVPLAYGIQKLQILAVVEDEKVSIDWLQEEIQNFEDFVQSVDIAAFQKI